MATRTSNSRQHTAVLEAIKQAETAAAKDDRAFLAAFRQHARASMPVPDGGGARSIGLPAGGVRPSAGPRLDADPRYLTNVRKLARRTAQNARIIGGTNVVAKEFDDCVAVGNDVKFGCTGTLIAPNVVLTAGHCEVLHTRIFVGNDTAKKGRVFRVKRHIRHPSWDNEFNNDLMLLILEKPVTGVTPRKLATATVVDKATDARVVGFGTTDTAGTKGYGTKQQTDVPIVSPACEGRVKGRSDRTVYGCHSGRNWWQASRSCSMTHAKAIVAGHFTCRTSRDNGC